MKTLLLQLVAILLLAGFAQADGITSIGDWTQSISAAALVSGAGSDLPAQFESISGVTTLTISHGSGSWLVRARLSGSGGHPNVTVYVRRTSNGSGSGAIAGGTNYIALSSTDTELFGGDYERNGVTLQFKITGLSRAVPPATYLSTIIFTLF